MTRYEIAYTYFLMKKYKKSLEEIDRLLSQFIFSNKPRILAQSLKEKIESGKVQHRSTY